MQRIKCIQLNSKNQMHIIKYIGLKIHNSKLSQLRQITAGGGGPSGLGKIQRKITVILLGIFPTDAYQYKTKQG